MGICDKRVVIVTGAGGGLGAAHARVLASEGAAVLVHLAREEGSPVTPLEAFAAGVPVVASRLPAFVEALDAEGRFVGLEPDADGSAAELASALERTLEESADRSALEAAAETRRLALRLEAEELLREEAALWPAGPQTSALLADWLERAGELAGQDEAVATLLGAEGGRLAEGRARLERLRACDAALEDGRWAEVHRSLVGTPAADLPPRYGLRPVELDEATGLWRLADLRTETDGTEPPLEFLLVPGLTLAGGELEPFFVARRPWSEEERRRLLGPDARPGLEPGARRTLDLARLGYRDPSSAEVALARRCGVELAPWSEQPVLPAIERR